MADSEGEKKRGHFIRFRTHVEKQTTVLTRKQKTKYTTDHTMTYS